LIGMKFPGNDIEDRMTKLGAKYIRAETLLDVSTRYTLDTMSEDQLAISVQSALITFFRTDRPNASRPFVQRVARGLEREGRDVYEACRTLCDRFPGIATAYVPNGRFPHQKLAALAFQNAGIRDYHIEKGEAPKRAYVQDYAPQDRLASQGSVDKLLAGLPEDSIVELADKWLAKRAPSTGSRNEFSALWTNTVPDEIRRQTERGAKIAGFFTPSQDEFQFLGPEWQLHEWDDQFVAFDKILTGLETDGYACYIRVHPNLATKAHECFLRERNGIKALAERHPALTVIWHDDPTNTYSLLEVSDAIVVWDSTVGLEASAHGIAVWTAATSRYGLTADVRELLSEGALDSTSLIPWVVDPLAAKRFIAYLVLRDQDVETSGGPWTAWAADHPPLAAKLAGAAVSGGIPRLTGAIWSLIDVYRHRGIRANMKALLRK